MKFDEKPKPEPLEKPKELSQLSSEQLREIQSSLPEVRHDITRLLGNFNNLRDNYPDEFIEINNKYPLLAVLTEQVRGLFEFLGEENTELSNEQLIHAISGYNLCAHEINLLLRRINRERKEDRESTLISAAHGELPFNEAEFTPAQKAVLRAFAQDLWGELFPESGVDQFVKWSTGQKDLEGYQKVLLAPANGIESAVVSIINLSKPKTYKELYTSIETISGLSYEDWCDLWHGLKFTYEQLPTTEKVAPVLSLICAIAFLSGGAGKIIQIAQKMGYSTKTVGVIKGVFVARTVSHVLDPVGKVIPLDDMLGITLSYIKPEGS